MFFSERCANGIVIQCQQSLSVTSYISCAFPCGYIDGNVKRMAHLVEHVLCEVLKEQIVAKSNYAHFKNLINAYTNLDSTVYWMRPMNTYYEIVQGVMMFAELISRLSSDLDLSGDMVKREFISVSAEEDKKCRNAKLDVLEKLYLPDQRCEDICIDQIKNFVKNNYTDITITVIGDVSCDELDNLKRICETKAVNSNDSHIKKFSRSFNQGQLEDGTCYYALQNPENYSINCFLYYHTVVAICNRIMKKLAMNNFMFYRPMRGHIIFCNIGCTHLSKILEDYLPKKYLEQIYMSCVYNMSLNLDDPQKLAMWHLKNQHAFGESISVETIKEVYFSFSLDSFFDWLSQLINLLKKGENKIC